MTANRRALMSHVSEMSALFVERLASLLIAQPDAISAAGLAISIDTGSERRAERIRSACQRRGLLLTTQGSRLMLLPPLTIREQDAQRGLDILETCATNRNRSR